MPRKVNMNQQLAPKGMKQLYALGKKRTIDLSLSENPLGCSPLVLRALKNLQSSTNDYPKPNGTNLKIALATAFSIPQSSFFISNGSGAVIIALTQTFIKKGDSVVVPMLTFPMFRICSKNAGARIISAKMKNDLGIDLQAIQRAIRSNTRIVFLCNPNNPTGGILTKTEMLSVIKALPKQAFLVVDEANIEFGGESMMSEVKNNAQLIVLRTFSKGLGLANLRIGFAVATERIVKTLEENSDIFPVSGLSESLAAIALTDTQFAKNTRVFITDQRGRMEDTLSTLGFTVFPSQANNLFVKLPAVIATDQFTRAIDRADISLVAGSSFPGFSDRFFRISVRKPEINTAFLKTMKKLVKGS